MRFQHARCSTEAGSRSDRSAGDEAEPNAANAANGAGPNERSAEGCVRSGLPRARSNKAPVRRAAVCSRCDNASWPRVRKPGAIRRGLQDPPRAGNADLAMELARRLPSVTGAASARSKTRLRVPGTLQAA